LKHLANALVFVSVLAAALPSLVPLVRRAIVFAPMSVEERRAHVMPDFYPSLRTIPRDQPAAILLLGNRALDRGVFVNYYLYPTPARMHQDRVSTDAPPSIVAVASEGPVRRTVVAHPPPPEAPRRFLVPFVASALGHDSYTTEAVIEGEGPVRVTLLPFGVTRTVTPPHVFSDVVQEMLGRRGLGWLRVESAGRVRASFHFVARADARVTPLPLLTGAPPPRQSARGPRLFLLNPADRAVTVRVNGRAETLGPQELREMRGDAENVVEGEVFVWSPP
jgi:hypothetical protein